jgi:hypothetical protein
MYTQKEGNRGQAFRPNYEPLQSGPFYDSTESKDKFTPKGGVRDAAFRPEQTVLQS